MTPSWIMSVDSLSSEDGQGRRRVYIMTASFCDVVRAVGFDRALHVLQRFELGLCLVVF